MTIPDKTLRQARRDLWEALEDGKTVRCECCGGTAKIYPRQVNRGMAISLIRMWRRGGMEFVHIPTVVGSRSREEGKLAYWGLIEEELERRPDGGRAGFWRVTQKGKDYLLGNITIPKYAMVYNDVVQDMVGPQVSIHDALKSPFDYDRLMRGDDEA